MTKNVANIDRIIRIVIAVVAAVFALSASGAMAIVLWVVAAIMLGTGTVAFCPIYRMFGISTRRS